MTDKLWGMATAVPLFYDDVTRFANLVMLFVFLVIESVAFVNCLTQRADAFPVVGPLSKAGWLAILGGSVLSTFVCMRTVPLLGFIAITATAIYLLDVRPALRDAASGSGNW